jgi:hypothetical protein
MLHFVVFRLHVINNNGHNFAINQIIYNASHYCPTSDTLDMVKHDLKFFQVSPKLHSCNKVHFVPNPINQHFEDENLVINFPWKTTFLDVIIMTHGLQFKEVVNVASLSMMLEQNKIMNIWRVQFNELVLDLFQLFTLKKLKVVSIIVSEQIFSQEIFARAQGNHKCFCIRCLVDLLFNQHFHFFHNFFTLTISNKVEMHTTVNHHS